jgi:hypothetical protein
MPAGETREIAIDEALDQHCYQEVDDADEDEPEQVWKAGFFICECRRRVIDLSRYFDAEEWLTMVEDQMCDEDGSDANGNNHPLEEIKPEDQRALEECVRTAIWHWQNRRGLPLRPWWLDMRGSPEWILVPLPGD